MQSNGDRPRWSTVLRALREARGVTLDGWGARLGVSRRTAQRWETGERAPDPGAEAAIIEYCRNGGLFRSYDRGPLAGVTLTAELLRELLAEARWRVRGSPVDAAQPSDPPSIPRPDRTPPETVGAPPSNLPVQLTSFIGRELEIAAVRRVQAGTRLLTLTGPGGSGKTRLALAVAEELLPAYPHGVWFVDLAPLADPALVPQAVASALAVRASGQQPVTEALIDALRGQHRLLLLDNCEHLLPACAALVETLLRACPELSVMTTSRASLGIGGETVWRVPPMTLPDAGDRGQGIPAYADPSAGDSEGSSDAVRLFVERARLQRPEFTPALGEASAVAEICRRLDGMPLAIELAAARLNVLSVVQIAERLHDRFRLLTTGDRTAMPRQQTLRAAIEWSHDLLSAPERALLRALSVFAGGFTLEAAEAIGEAVGSPQSAVGELPERSGSSLPSPAPAGEGALPIGDCPLPAADVLDLLAHLVDQSLVIAEERDGLVRYRLLETVREFAAEQLVAAGDGPRTRDLHAAWCAALAEAGVAHRTGPEQDKWLKRLTVEHDNVRAALGWCLAQEHETTVGLRLAAAMWWFWEGRGHLSEGRRWLNALLERGDAAPPDLRARALGHAGWLAYGQGDYDEAERRHEQSMALASELGDEAGVATALNYLGVVAVARTDYTRARALYEESLALQRKLGNRHALATSANNLGIIARRQGDLTRAEALYEESLALLRELGDTRGVAGSLANLGNLHRDQGALEKATARYCESLTLYRELQEHLGVPRCLEGLAAVAAACGDAERAARLCGAASALREAIGAPAQPVGRVAFAQTVADVRSALSEAAFAMAWSAGAALSLEEATAEALTEPAPD